MEISDILLQKYNVAVPRYTSYPPANHFSNDFSEQDYLNLITASNQDKPEHIALYIHIPFCKKICYYCGCNACPIGRGNQVHPYIGALKKEIVKVAGMIDKNRKVSQIHFGGGTPNAIDSSYLKEINELFFSLFSFIEDPEIAIECNPAYLDPDYIKELKAAGFNRFSLGIQDFNKSVLKSVNREPSSLPVGELIQLLKAGEKKISVNLDFIYGLPGQNAASFSKTIKQAIELRPDRLVTFSYAHVPWMKKHQIILEKKGLPGPDEKMEMFLSAYELLKSAGYKFIGFDHYVLPDDELNIAYQNHLLHRNFQGYCTRRTTGQVYAFGVSAISQLDRGYAQNTKEVQNYIDIINNDNLPIEKGITLTPDQQITREAITELMCNRMLNWEDLGSKLSLPAEQLRDFFVPDFKVFDRFVEDGLVIFSDDAIRVTETGSLFIRNIAAAIDPAFQKQENKYSKAV
jgi:oxygen-independent coproporphyrinogen-3 oxidase